jgi:hypothetical protein
MPPETKTDCETEKHVSVSEKLAICNCYKQFAALHFDMVTISFVCNQKPHSLQRNQIHGNLVTNIPKS